jgi:hypothetical protein
MAKKRRAKRRKAIPVVPYFVSPFFLNYSTSGDSGAFEGGSDGGGGMEEGEDEDVRGAIEEIRAIIREVLLEAEDDSLPAEMTKVGQADGMYGLYDLYVGYANKSGYDFKRIYNVVRSGDPKPASGYFDPSHILSIKKLPLDSFDGL